MYLNKNLKILLSYLITFIMAISFMPSSISMANVKGVPGKAILSHNQWGADVDGNYDITCNLYYGINGTSYKLYESLGLTEKYSVVSEGKLIDNSPNQQSFTVKITDRKAVGMYRYYVEIINSQGSTRSEILDVKVGKDGDAPILINPIDVDGVKIQHTVDQGVANYLLQSRTNTLPVYTVISSNPSVATAAIKNGNTLEINAKKSGRTGIKIVDNKTGEIRQIGFRVREDDGTLPGMPDYLSIGQVSEDNDKDLKFWSETSNDDTNKYVDIRYIYINGGPLGDGWRNWTSEDGDRAKSYIRESLKLGMIPFFVYYNIPDMGESYELDIEHINDTTYMDAYYKDLKFFLDICKEYAGDETVGIIFEPDFLGYMMQQANKQPNEISAVVNCAYTSGVLDENNDPIFENSVKGLVESINYTVQKYYDEAYFGWQFNIWSYDSHEIPAQGLLHKTEFIGWDPGRQFIKQVASETASYYLNAGIDSYGADFISIDKYGLDGGHESALEDDPVKTKWFWNADIWNNYLLYTKTLHEVTQKPVILWQIPVGRINSTQESNPYNGGGKFKELPNKERQYEDSAPSFFFGDTFKPGLGNRFDYFSTNIANDPKITKNSDGTVTWGDHMKETNDAGIISILFGAGIDSSTDAVGYPPTDDFWWITKAQRYFKNPFKLDNGGITTPNENLPLKGSLSVLEASNNGNYDININIPSNSKAKNYILYENGKQVLSGQVVGEDILYKYSVLNKPTGTYLYKVDLVNEYGLTSSANLTILVNNNTSPPIDIPLKPNIFVDNPNNNGNYNITIDIPANSKGTSYNLYENNRIIKTGNVTNLKQTIVTEFKNKISGTYNYKVDLINKDASTSSENLEVRCISETPSTGVNIEFFVVQDWGSSANFEIVITNNSNKDISNWELNIDFIKKINTIYNCDLTNIGSKYKIKPSSWNNTIKSNEKITIGGTCEGNIGDNKPQIISFIYDGYEESIKEGDVNNDGIVDILDLSLVAKSYNCISGNPFYNINYDFNKDDVIDIFDLIFISIKI